MAAELDVLGSHLLLEQQRTTESNIRVPLLFEDLAQFPITRHLQPVDRDLVVAGLGTDLPDCFPDELDQLHPSSIGLLLATADLHVSSDQRLPPSIQGHLTLIEILHDLGLTTKTGLVAFQSFLVSLIISQQTLITQLIDHVDAG